MNVQAGLCLCCSAPKTCFLELRPISSTILIAVDPGERNTKRSGVRSAMCAASQLPDGGGGTDKDDAPTLPCLNKNLMMMVIVMMIMMMIVMMMIMMMMTMMIMMMVMIIRDYLMVFWLSP